VEDSVNKIAEMPILALLREFLIEDQLTMIVSFQRNTDAVSVAASHSHRHIEARQIASSKGR
jgi:hypothetical protein